MFEDAGQIARVDLQLILIGDKKSIVGMRGKSVPVNGAIGVMQPPADVNGGDGGAEAVRDLFDFECERVIGGRDLQVNKEGFNAETAVMSERMRENLGGATDNREEVGHSIVPTSFEEMIRWSEVSRRSR